MITRYNRLNKEPERCEKWNVSNGLFLFLDQSLYSSIPHAGSDDAGRIYNAGATPEPDALA